MFLKHVTDTYQKTYLQPCSLVLYCSSMAIITKPLQNQLIVVMCVARPFETLYSWPVLMAAPSQSGGVWSQTAPKTGSWNLIGRYKLPSHLIIQHIL